MGLFNSTCCPPKPRRTIDYILNWIDKYGPIITKDTSYINDLLDWRRTVENDLDGYVKNAADEYITNYDWSQVPELDAKADKVKNAVLGHLASIDAKGNLVDSGSGVDEAIEQGNMDLATCNAVYVALQGKTDKVSNAVTDNLASLDAEGNLQDSGKKASDFAPAIHNHDNIIYQDSDGVGRVYTTSSEEDGGEVHIIVKKGNGNYKSAMINDANINNLIRALTTPSSAPEDDDTKLITSKAVYDALLGKMNKILTLRIDVNTSDGDYPMTTEADSLLSAFVNNVSVGTYVPVLVELHTQSATVGTILGVAKWTLEGQEDEHDVTIRLGSLLFSTSRLFDGQQQWDTFLDWTKSSSQDIEDYFL